MLTLNVNDLVEYTDWERQKWHAWLLKHGQETLEMSIGPHGDGRFPRVGDVIKHIFGAEKRYVERLYNQPLTDFASLPNTIEAIFDCGRQSRGELRDLLEKFPAEDWDTPREFKILTFVAKVTPRKIAVHILMHEIRHWAQLATLFRMNGYKVEFSDFLFSPVYGGEFGRA